MDYTKLYDELQLNENKQYFAMARKAKEYDDLAFCKPVYHFIRENTDIKEPRVDSKTANRFISYFYIAGLFTHIKKTTESVSLATAMARTQSIKDEHVKKILQLAKSDLDLFYNEMVYTIRRMQANNNAVNIQELAELVYNVINHETEAGKLAETPIYKLFEDLYIARDKLKHTKKADY